MSEIQMKWQRDEFPRFPVTSVEPGQTGKGIVVRSSNWLGDAVMTLPALKQLRTILPPQAGLFVISPKGLVPLYQSLGSLVDAVVPLKDAHAFPDFSEYAAIRKLGARTGVLFNNSFRDALALRLAGVKNLYGAKARNRSWLLRSSWTFPKRLDHELNYPHQSAKYLAMIYALGGELWDGKMPEITPAADWNGVCGKLLPGQNCENILAIAPGAAYGDGKRWAAESFRAVAAAWLDKCADGCVLALGSKAELPGCEEALRGLPPSRVFNLAGKTTLDELMVILQHVQYCVANDSGIMHLSGTVGGRGIAVYGSTDPAATSPISEHWTLLYDKLPCSPCFKRNCPLGTKACLDRIKPQSVIDLLV